MYLLIIFKTTIHKTQIGKVKMIKRKRKKETKLRNSSQKCLKISLMTWIQKKKMTNNKTNKNK